MKAPKEMQILRQDILQLFGSVTVDDTWSFSDKKRKDTNYITHGYHRYPAKFIPQLASRLIEAHTQEGDLVIDPFGGCGTTLVEAKVTKRPSVGVDINPVSVLVAKTKTTSIPHEKLEESLLGLAKNLTHFDERKKIDFRAHERIDYWFLPSEKNKLSFLFLEIAKIKDTDIRELFYCAFSHILKNCSIWLQSSNKPTRDFKKKISDPFKIFMRHMNLILRGNKEFWSLLREGDCGRTPCDMYNDDARHLPVQSHCAQLIVTSPPYVTSYEYADLHQLSAFWFDYTRNLSEFRKNFIGTAHPAQEHIYLGSVIAEMICEELALKSQKKSKEVKAYFGDMYQSFKEMKRVLKKGGKLCIVIGNTTLKGVPILNAEVFTEQLTHLGFSIDAIVKREIPSKNLPSTRDEKTGRFAKSTDTNKVFAYPTEYIVTMQKQ